MSQKKSSEKVCSSCGSEITPELRKKIIQEYFQNGSPKLPKIDVTKGYFETENHRYWIQPDKLSIARYKQYKWMTHDVVFNEDVKKTIDKLIHINELATGKTKEYNLLSVCSKIANETHELTMKLMDMTTLNTRLDRVLMLVALFCNRDDEDIRIYDEKIQLEKVKDWEEHGFDIEGFFLLCFLALKQLNELYRYISNNDAVPTEPSKKVQR